VSGNHRRPVRAATYLLRTTGGSIVAVGIVVAVIAIVNAANGDDGNGNGGSPVVAASSPVSPSNSVAGSAVITTPSPSATDLGPASAPAQPATTSPPAVAPGSRGTVVVYDGAKSAGLTEKARARLVAAGYAVQRVRDVNLPLERTTVYYDSGQASAAQALVDAHLGVLDAKPRPTDILLRTGTLIVVVAPSFS
jgi:hypothetical protein